MPGPKYTKEQKTWFFDLLDKGGTVRAAARTVGAHEAAAYSWVRAAGLTMQRESPRVYTDDEKAEFFRRLAERPNVPLSPASLGSRELPATRGRTRPASSPAKPIR